MKTAVVIILLLIVYFVFVSALTRSQRRANVIDAKNGLVSAFVDFQNGETLTNSWNLRHHAHSYTNRYVIDGAVYQCAIAVDSWDYQGLSNLLTLTTNKSYLYIDSHGAIPVGNMPPGY